MSETRMTGARWNDTLRSPNEENGSVHQSSHKGVNFRKLEVLEGMFDFTGLSWNGLRLPDWTW